MTSDDITSTPSPTTQTTSSEEITKRHMRNQLKIGLTPEEIITNNEKLLRRAMTDGFITIEGYRTSLDGIKRIVVSIVDEEEERNSEQQKT